MKKKNKVKKREGKSERVNRGGINGKTEGEKGRTLWMKIGTNSEGKHWRRRGEKEIAIQSRETKNKKEELYKVGRGRQLEERK